LSGAAPARTVDAVQQDALYPTEACVQNLVRNPAGAYPLTQRLYYNSRVGFENAFADEKALVECASNQAYISNILNNRGFTPMPVAPVCVDFNEPAQCGPLPNINACANNSTISVDPRASANGTSIPSNTDLVIP
jgi:hypothetical protein